LNKVLELLYWPKSSASKGYSIANWVADNIADLRDSILEVKAKIHPKNEKILSCDIDSWATAVFAFPKQLSAP
jgi:hypothetical protein